MKLRKRDIDQMTYEGDGKSRDVRWSDDLRGFGVRVYPTNRKAFVLSYRTNGRKRLITIGSYGPLTLKEAEKRARRLIANVEYEDPLEERQRTARGETVKELCFAYLERYAMAQKKSWKDDEGRINRHMIPAWGNLKAVNIKHADVAALHSRIGKKHRYEANRLVALISKMFELARRWGFVPSHHENPAHNIEHFKEEKRDRWVTPEELPKLAEAIDEEENIYARSALWLYLLTGARRSELLTARWENVDWNRKELKFVDTKNGKNHYLPLSDAALTALKAIPRIEENAYILPGLKAGAHLINIDKPCRRVRSRATVKLWASQGGKTAELIETLSKALEREPSTREVRKAADFDLPPSMEDVRLHDLRRTVGSWLAQAGNSLHLIGRVLNHSNQSTTAIYARFGQDQVREALDQHGQRIMGTAKKKQSAEVIKLGGTP